MDTSASWQQNRDALQAENDSVAARGGGRVVIPPGTYMVADVVQDARVEFYGPGVTLVAPDSTSAVIVRSRVLQLSGTVAGNILTVADATGVEVGAPISIRRAGGISETQNTALTSARASSATSFPVVTTRNFPSSGLLRIGDELVIYSSITPTSFEGLNRGVFGSLADAYSVGRVVGQSSYHYAEVASVDGNTIALSTSVAIPGAVTVTAEAGILRPKLTDIAFEGGWYAVTWSAARWGEGKGLSFNGCGMGGLILQNGASDNTFTNLQGRGIGNPSASMGAFYWMFRGCRRNTFISPSATGVGYHGFYIDDRTSTGSERDAPCYDNTIGDPHIDIPRAGSNTGVMIVGSSGNKVIGGSIAGVRSAVIVDANQITRHDDGVVPAEGNLVNGTSMRDTFQGIAFRQPGNRAVNVPMWNVPVQVTPVSLNGNAVVGVGDGFAAG